MLRLLSSVRVPVEQLGVGRDFMDDVATPCAAGLVGLRFGPLVFFVSQFFIVFQSDLYHVFVQIPHAGLVHVGV